ncbi:MAG: glycosyltransferase family 2 protein [Elusimicrobiota bacterium]|nr:glycosyltransferase family 2 protein [Endomicrobiia bacterium]MCX7910179.1 glycosyltransferase family 2 protein [Endomicrobiia bacterium]MDW8165525.1 glycosyltransferase family 2 protein [Elusimicrobiota bacterium]
MKTELSVILPCLNEENSIEICIKKIKDIFKKENINGEIIVVDNGSTDRSVEIIKKHSDVKLLFETQKGYGAALRKGIDNAEGKYIIMGDADNTYDFYEIPKFLEKLKEGYDLVMGSRFKGKILKNAMSWSHRYIGNPLLSGMLRLFFGGNISDAHCGLRAFTKEAYQKMNLRTTGMEFASEMVIHALKKNLKITEIPITYYPRIGESKLSSFRDAWRHIRFMLLYSPDYLFLLPGLVFLIIGLTISLGILIRGHILLLGRSWGVHVLFFSSIITLIGWQILNIWLSAKAFTHSIGLEDNKFIKKLLTILNLERILLFGLSLFLGGIVGLLYIIYIWAKTNFGPLEELRLGIFSLMIAAMGIQTIFGAFLSSVVQIKYQ